MSWPAGCSSSAGRIQQRGQLPSHRDRDGDSQYGANRLHDGLLGQTCSPCLLQNIELEDLFAAKSWMLYLPMRCMKRITSKAKQKSLEPGCETARWLLRSKLLSLCELDIVEIAAPTSAQDVAGTPEEAKASKQKFWEFQAWLARKRHALGSNALNLATGESGRQGTNSSRIPGNKGPQAWTGRVHPS